MANWIRTVSTQSGQPAQCFNEAGEEVFVLVLLREGGGSDERIPRRVVGTGRTRALANTRAFRALRRYDRMGVVVPSREQAADDV